MEGQFKADVIGLTCSSTVSAANVRCCYNEIIYPESEKIVWMPYKRKYSSRRRMYRKSRHLCGIVEVAFLSIKHGMMEEFHPSVWGKQLWRKQCSASLTCQQYFLVSYGYVTPQAQSLVYTRNIFVIFIAYTISNWSFLYIQFTFIWYTCHYMV